MKIYGAKKIKCVYVDVHLHYANNAGRGSDNVTVTVVKKETKRMRIASRYIEYIDQYKTSGWQGYVNFANDRIKSWGGIIEHDGEKAGFYL